MPEKCSINEEKYSLLTAHIWVIFIMAKVTMLQNILKILDIEYQNVALTEDNAT